MRILKTSLSAVTLMVTLSLVLPGAAQTAGFEAATIKPTPMAGRGGPRKVGGCRGIDSKAGASDSLPLGRCVVNAVRLSEMIGAAYNLPLSRISGVPEWDVSSFFDLEGKAENPLSTTEHDLRLMLQNLLTERFKLVLRHPAVEAPVFALHLGKNGSKLRASKEDSEKMTPEGGSLVFRGYTMSKLAEFLSGLPSVGRPVQDMTGLSGRFDFTLTILDVKPENAGELKAGISKWDSVLSDVQEQLGLRVESQKASLEAIVIDHAEKPTEN